jgi:outer membrane receptor for ferrienterochelin and colicin
MHQISLPVMLGLFVLVVPGTAPVVAGEDPARQAGAGENREEEPFTEESGGKDGLGEELAGSTITITARELAEGLYEYDLFGVLAALRTKAGITVKSSSDVGAEDWLLVRGLPRDSARNLLVLVDGMPLNDAYSEANEFEHLPPIDLIDRIVVHRPPLPARLGGYSAVVEVITKGEPRRAWTEVSAAGGDYSSGSAAAVTEGHAAGFAWRGAVETLVTDNLTGQRRTPPYASVVYGDRSYRKIHAAAQGLFRAGDASRFRASAHFLDSEKFFSDTIFRGEQESRDRRLAHLNLGYLWQPGDRSRLSLSLFRADESYQLNLMMHPDVQDQDRVKQGLRLTWDRELPRKHRLSAGGEFTDLHVVERLGTPLALEGARFYALFVEDRFTPNDRWIVVVGMRRDGHAEASSHWSPSLSVAFAPAAANTLHVAWGRSVRWPSLSEISEADPANGLEAEEQEALELGFRQSFAKDRAAARLTIFRIDLDGESAFFLDMSAVPPVGYQRNEPDTVRSEGIEMETEVTFNSAWRGFFNYTYNRLERRPGDTPVSFSGPRHLANLGVTWTKRRWGLDLTARYGSEAEGVQRTMGAPTDLDPWLLLDVAGHYRLWTHLDLFARASNLLDEDHETFEGRPMFGRVVFGGVRALF